MPVVVAAMVLALGGCAGSLAGEDSRIPANVTVRSHPDLPAVPADLYEIGGRLSELVDFHDGDFSGSWYDADDESYHVGVATEAGRDLLHAEGLTDLPDVVVDEAERSLAEGQRVAQDFVDGSSFRDQIVGWGALPAGDGISLAVSLDHLEDDQLDELGALPFRVVVTTGQQPATLG